MSNGCYFWELVNGLYSNIWSTGIKQNVTYKLFCNCAMIENLGGNLRYRNLMIFRIQTNAKQNSWYKRVPHNAEQIRYRNHWYTRIWRHKRVDKDSENVKKIIEILKNTNHINCVCLVVNGHSARLNPSFKYVLTEITNIYHKR